MEVSGQFHAPAALPHGKSAWYTLNRRLGKFFTEFLNIKNDHPHPHYTFCHVCGNVSWAQLPWSRDRSWWSASQAIKISKPQIPDFYLWGEGGGGAHSRSVVWTKSERIRYTDLSFWMLWPLSRLVLMNWWELCAACAKRCVQAGLVNLNIYCKFGNKEIYLSAYSYFCFTSSLWYICNPWEFDSCS